MRTSHAALLILLLVAGCVTPPAADDDDPAPSQDAVTLDWGLSGCQLVVAFIPVDAARVQPRLPEGFRVLSIEETGFPPDPRGSGNLGTEMFVCEEGIGLNGTVADMTYGSVFVQVEPPAEHQREDITLYFVKWDVLVPDAERRAFLTARGLPAIEGGASFANFRAQGDQAAFDGELEMNGTTAFRGASVLPAPDALRNFRFTEFMPTPDGFAFWNTTVELAGGSAGAGTVELSGLAAEIAGASEVQGYYLAAEGSFTNATIWLPPRAG